MRDLTAEYVAALGLAPWTTGWIWRSTWVRIDPDRVRVVGRGWQATRYPISPRAIGRGLAGECGLDLRDQSQIRFLGVDIDCHDLDGSQEAGDALGIDEWLGAGKPHQRRRRLRERIAERARPTLEAVRAATPGAEWVVLASPRGLHMVALLDEFVSAQRAAELADGVLALIGRPKCVETFPRVEAGGRTCRLPLTGGSRLLADDLVRLRHGRRAADLVELLSTKRTPIEALAALENRCVRIANPAEIKPNCAPRRREHTALPPEHPQNLPLDLPGDADLRDRLSRHLRGQEFADTMIELLRAGTPDDASFDAARKIAALAVYAGMASKDATALGRAFIERPGHHRCTHAQTAAGRSQWMQVYRSCLRRQQAGVARDEIRPRLANPALVAAVAQLLGRQPGRRRRSSEATRLAARKAAQTRWARSKAA